MWKTKLLDRQEFADLEIRRVGGEKLRRGECSECRTGRKSIDKDKIELED